MKKIYLACPYTHNSALVKEHRFKFANHIAAQLMKAGNIVFSPISHSHPIATQCGLDMGLEFWMAQDLSFIQWCDELVVLTIKGWEESKGVTREIEIASYMKKEIRYLRYPYEL